jgi:hypothetical protein
VRQLIRCLGVSRWPCVRGRRSDQRKARDRSVLLTLSAATTHDDAVAQNIPVISTINRASVSTLYRGRRTNRECFLKPITRTFAAPVSLGVLNACSVANKTASISSWIADEKLTFAAVVETWHDGCDSPALIASTPPRYQYVDRARPRHNADLTTNHSGVALFFQTFPSATVIQLPEYTTFESIGVFDQVSGVHMLVVVIYRPGSASPCDRFFDDFTDLLECARRPQHSALRDRQLLSLLAAFDGF